MKRFLLFLWVFAALTGISSHGYSDPLNPSYDWEEEDADYLEIPEEPPPPKLEKVPPSPGPEYVWAPGYWDWNGKWVWVAGHWTKTPYPGAIWQGGYWEKGEHGWIWRKGEWR